MFAAELLLPGKLFEPAAAIAPVSLAGIDTLANQFEASVTSTGSRYADSVSTPCAFVLSHKGKVINASRSKALKDANAFIERRLELPPGSISERTRAGDTLDRGEIDAAAWFSNWERGGALLEEARHLKQWDQTLTLLWFENEEVPSPRQHVHRARRWETEGRDLTHRREEEDEFGLKELDGQLR